MTAPAPGPACGLLPAPDWAPYLARYRAGEWRDRIFRDLILADAAALGRRPTLLDIGCGAGLDGDVPLQRSLAAAAARYIGVEPDPGITPGDYFDEVHRCPFEAAELPEGSVDIAFAVMVLEHLEHPQPFWDRLHAVLAEGGLFWALTVDARHLFGRLSLGMGRLGLTDLYLDALYGRRGPRRYDNYPTFYRSNTPGQVRRLARRFRSCELLSLARVGQWSPYLPAPLRGLADRLDRRAIRRGRPGTLLVLRAQK
jgi:SAM-dependent methyltransferase